MNDAENSHGRCAKSVRRLNSALTELESNAQLLRLDPLAGREWYELLRQKLVPQLADDAFLVVAVVGGTNIGKSVIFNHLAGCRASSTSPLASGTRHPVCLVPSGFEERHDLNSIFHGFTLEAWTGPDKALSTTEEHMLFWRTDDTMPGNLLVLDTPDIDSDSEINWVRADGIRRCADVLIAVLTQQKYNDAAVKQFFRKAAEEDKAIIIVFNQCLLPDDEQFWPVWSKTFCEETGIIPEALYLSPNDRAAAEENRLPFLEREWPHNPDSSPAQEPRDLSADLSRLRFRETKLRTLRGSIRRILRADNGVPAYLNEVTSHSNDFASAAERLSSESVVRVQDWPTIDNGLVVGEIRSWWKSRQQGWARKVNGVYDTVGRGFLWPYRAIRDSIQGEPEPPIEIYRRKEWAAVLRTVEEIFDKLSFMSESGSELLRPRLEKLMAGKSRVDLLENLREKHDAVDLDATLEQTVQTEMKAFKEGSPELFNFYRQLNNVSAAVRPVTSVVLFTLGWGPAGEAVAPFVADAAAQAVVPIVANMAGGTTAALAGEVAVTEAAGSSMGWLQAYFRKLQTTFTSLRVNWLIDLLRSELLGSLPEDLQVAAGVPRSAAFAAIQTELKALEKELATQHGGS